MNVPRIIKTNVVFRVAVMILLLVQCSLASANTNTKTKANTVLIFTSPPRETPAAGQKQYGPIAAELTKVLGVKVKYVHPQGWLFYQRDMREDKYDIIFDGPHFISWRIKRYHHIPVARLPGTLSFILFTKKSNKALSKLDDLYNAPVCGIAPPNLATLTLLAAYPNPVRQPELVTVKGGAPGIYKAFMAGKCEAAIIRDKFYNRKIPEAVRAKLKVLYKSKPVTNQGIDVSSRVTPEEREKIAKVLTAPNNKALMPTLKRFGGKAKKMIPATVADYADQYKLLTGIIFGWEIPQ